MWGGRFASGPSSVMEAINTSVHIDQRMAEEDIAGSLAHAAMLSACGIISSADHEQIAAGLKAVREDIRADRFEWQAALEDVHMNIEAALREKIGAAAGRLHTARSRNDQVATDFRLWLRSACDRAIAGLRAYQQGLVSQADAHADWVMPGFTHLQTAQPVSLGHHLLCWVEAAERDIGRFEDTRKRLNESPLGAAALAGTAFAIDRDSTAQALGFLCRFCRWRATSAKMAGMSGRPAWTWPCRPSPDSDSDALVSSAIRLEVSEVSGAVASAPKGHCAPVCPAAAPVWGHRSAARFFAVKWTRTSQPSAAAHASSGSKQRTSSNSRTLQTTQTWSGLRPGGCSARCCRTENIGVQPMPPAVMMSDE